MCEVIVVIIVYLAVELMANLLLFYPLKKIYGSKRADQEKTAPWLKGMLERLCLNLGLLLGYPHVLIAFGALKIGTKINGESINSEYYLLGNLASISTCFLFIYIKDSEAITNMFYNLFNCL